MFRFLLGYALVLMISLGLSSFAYADSLILQSGQKIEGRIIERTELRVMIEVKGVPKTYFLGEIASIDGDNIVAPKPKDVPVAEEKKPIVPLYGDQQVSLDRFMNKRNSNVSAQGQPAAAQKAPAGPQKQKTNFRRQPGSSAFQTATRLESLLNEMHEMMGKMAVLDKNVVSTPDGGIIVVSPDKIIKYDKNLNVVKEVDLKTNHSIAP